LFGLFFVIQKHKVGINSNGKSSCYRENHIFPTIIAHHLRKINSNKNFSFDSDDFNRFLLVDNISYYFLESVVNNIGVCNFEKVVTK